VLQAGITLGIFHSTFAVFLCFSLGTGCLPLSEIDAGLDGPLVWLGVIVRCQVPCIYPKVFLGKSNTHQITFPQLERDEHCGSLHLFGEECCACTTAK